MELLAGRVFTQIVDPDSLINSYLMTRELEFHPDLLHMLSGFGVNLHGKKKDLILLSYIFLSCTYFNNIIFNLLNSCE